MKISEIEMRNFGPYLGTHPVDMSTTPGAPIIVMHGENTWGKTSFLNAIRWCLYGRVRGIDRRDKALWRLINRDAFKTGERIMSVKLNFTHGGVPYELERFVAFHEQPTSSTKLSDEARLVEDGNVVPEARIAEKIGSILHEDISRFFLFDAEMLDEFERLVESGDTGNVVKQQIEQALGLPALRLAEEDLADLVDAATRKQFKAIKSSKKGAAIEAEARQAQDQLQSLDSDIKSLVAFANEMEQKRDAAKERRAQFSEIQASVANLERVEAQIKEQQQVIADAKSDCMKVLAASWWMPLSARLKDLAMAAKGRVDLGQERQDEVANLRVKIKEAEVSVGANECSQCHQPISEEMKSALGIQQRSLASRLSELEAQTHDHALEIRRLATVVQFVSGIHLTGFREKELHLRRLALELRALERKQRNLLDQLAGHDRDEIRAVERDYENAVIVLDRLQRDLFSNEQKRDALRATLDRLQKQAEILPGQNPRISAEVAVYSALREVFRRGIDRFRERLRKDVEKEASAIFRELTTEKDFAGLRINDNYGLVIIDTRGEPLPDRSAGAAQTIALALVGALNKSALREGPIVVDTPLGRLDLGHRANVLRFFPTMGPQVMFMPHSGEFDRKVHLPIIEGKISHELKIVRDNLKSKIANYGS